MLTFYPDGIRILDGMPKELAEYMKAVIATEAEALNAADINWNEILKNDKNKN